MKPLQPRDADAPYRKQPLPGRIPERGWVGVLDELWMHPATRSVRAGLASAAALLLPVDCVSCRRPDAIVCPSCAKAMRMACLRPRRVEARAEALPLDADGEPLPVVAAGSYDHELAAVVLAFKNHQMPALGGLLAPQLARAVLAGLDGMAEPGRPVVLVPMPTRLRARARRGYHPVGLLMVRLRRSGVLPGEVGSASLLRYRFARQFTAAQKGKGRRARGSVRQSMRAPDTSALRHCLASGAQVLLIDDVLSTGATLAEAHRALRGSGVPVCGAVVLAATPAPDGKYAVRSTR